MLTLSTQWVSPALSSPLPQSKICFEPEEAKKVLVEIKFGQVTAERLFVVQKSYSTCTAINKNNETVIAGLKKDKDVYFKMSEDYKKKYVETNDALKKAEENQPSRAVWAGIGAGATAILGILLAFLVRK